MLQNSCLFNRFYKIPAVLIDGLKQQNAVGKTKFGVKSIYQGLVSIFLIYEIERETFTNLSISISKNLWNRMTSQIISKSHSTLSLSMCLFLEKVSSITCRSHHHHHRGWEESLSRKIFEQSSFLQINSLQ